MESFDLIILIPLLWGAIMGFRKGLILELASIVGLVLGIWGSLKFSNFLAVYLSQHISASPSLIGMLAFGLTFLIIVVLVYLLAKTLDKVLKMAAMGMLIRISGAFFGILKYALILTILLFSFEWINDRWEFVPKKKYEDSYAYQAYSAINGPLINWVQELDIELELDE